MRRTVAFLCLSRIGELTVFQRIKSSGFNLQIKFTNHTVIPAVSTQHIRSRMHLNLTRRAWPYVPPNQVLVLAHVDNQMPAHNCIGSRVHIDRNWSQVKKETFPRYSYQLLANPLGPRTYEKLPSGQKMRSWGCIVA